MAAAEEGPEPLRYQTLALRVSIHCEGCKKKVKKVLHSIEGVYKTDIDTQHQKVVVIGNVSADALVKKLLKSGKHAEPWPEPAAPAPPAAGGSPPGPGGSPGSGGGKKKKKKKSNKSPAAATNSKPAEPVPAPAPAEGNGGPSPPEQHDKADGGASCDEASDGEQDNPEAGGGGGNGSPDAGEAHESGASGKVAPFSLTPHGPQPIAPATNGNGGGGGGKKKGKKGGHRNANSNGNANANGDGAGAGAIVEVHPPDAAPTKPAAGNSGPLTVVDAGPYPPPPPGAAMSYPGYYAAGGVHSPAYVMSYSTAHPSSALRSSAYYHPMAGAAYTPEGGGGGYFYSTAPVSAAPGSYYMFSEENANACSVM
ncbi:unnamed protein product [Miscanthus lutarioriparius]|uniref:HMA domain-containing protein n=1 Tax=Miscanthus lutarioriparius TaxID=422564 RepID=A0A811RSS4_9POAL|nr:unnamed protein product [Miscanthus lutarioriparius]